MKKKRPGRNTLQLLSRHLAGLFLKTGREPLHASWVGSDKSTGYGVLRILDMRSPYSVLEYSVRRRY